MKTINVILILLVLAFVSGAFANEKLVARDKLWGNPVGSCIVLHAPGDICTYGMTSEGAESLRLGIAAGYKPDYLKDAVKLLLAETIERNGTSRFDIEHIYRFAGSVQYIEIDQYIEIYKVLTDNSWKEVDEKEFSALQDADRRRQGERIGAMRSILQKLESQ